MRYTIMLKYGLPLTAEHYMAIGQVAAIWQALEVAVQAAIWATLGLDDAHGQLATASLRFDTHLDILTVLATREAPEIGTQLGAMIRETKRLQDERNTVIHGLWYAPGDFLAPRPVRFRVKDATRQVPGYRPEQIFAIADQIAAMRDRWFGYVDAQAASSRTPAPPNPPPPPFPN